jgi:hypothetical protein
MILKGQVAMSRPKNILSEAGSALLLTLVVLFLLSLLGIYMSLNANTGLLISDNYETQIQATYAALAGLNHARALTRGLDFNDLLKGPDGNYDTSASYIALARKPIFRNPIPLLKAQSLNILDPVSDLSGFPDDGLINTGFYGGSAGMALIAAAGVGLVSKNPYGPGEILNARYFVKIADNNGDPSETKGDPDDNPFVDGDGVVIVRSIGLSKTFSEVTGSIRRSNSIAVFESRLKRSFTFDAGPAVVVLGSEVIASFEGTCEISGDLFPGIGAIDTDIGDALFPDSIIRTAAEGRGNITGGGLPNPSVQEISARIRRDPDRSLLLDPRFLWNFTRNRAPRIADYFFDGDQFWPDGSAPYVGSYDASKAWNAPGQDPKITVVNGDLHVSGGFSGGGLLIVTGGLYCSGPYRYDGLVLVIGSGNLVADGSGPGIEGGLLAASLADLGGEIVFGTPGVSISGNSRFRANRSAVRTAVGLIPVSQISFREITGADP